MEPQYNPKETEEKIYKLWEESGFFNPDKLPGKRKKIFTIMMPPPNATGFLHIGHAFEDTIQDILIRYHRMKGEKTLWLPGTDHAAIATNTRVEKELIKKEGKNRHDLGKEAFIKRVEEFVQEHRGIIQKQIRRMGASCDWSREAFTFDEKRNLAVRAAFKKMYDAGLIYRGFKVINWDPKGQTAVSDDEIVYKPEKGKLYTFRYSKDFPIAIATTRPETKLGDTAVAVNPKDSRYQKFVGKEYNVKFCGVDLKIKIIADKEIDPEFGTGAVGVTPAHSIVDSEIAARHNLPAKQVINEYAKMTVGDLVIDKKTKEAREIVAQWIRDNQLMEKEEVIDINISTADRSGGVIEPLPKMQWFVDVNKKFKQKGKTVSLKKLMHDSVSSGKIKIMPERFEKIYFNWINNLRDWNISRQIWYGHKIPVWYRDKQVHVGIEKPDGEGWKQDEDTLDTWFSSALWTFSTLGWPQKTKDLKTFHPTQVMAPGYEILFFWVARMILMSTFLLEEIPFKTVYLHGIVRDSSGQKFSKSMGNGIDPIEVIDQFGADALRMSLIVGVGPGNDSKFDMQRVKGYRNFANKIWNASRFVLMQPEKNQQTKNDKKLLKDFEKFAKEITRDMDNFKFYIAAEKIYHYFWHTFCDKIIEDYKQKKVGYETILTLLEKSLKILHPFMPFITEEIYQQLPIKNRQKSLMVESWPK